MIPTPPGMCLFCMMRLPHPTDLAELLGHQPADAVEPFDFVSEVRDEE